MIFIEESAFCSNKLFNEIISPTLVQDESCLVALSTVSYVPEHFFARLIANVNKSFKVERIKYVCDTCAKEKRDKKMTYCIHNADFVPHWNNEDNLGIIAELVGKEGLRTFLVENLGLDPERPVSEVFRADMVRAFVASARRQLTSPIRDIFVVVDPCGGSIKDYKDRPSDFAVVTIGSPGNVILGMESIGANKEEDYEDRLVAHIRRIQANRYCQNARIVVDVETGTGFTAGNVNKLIKQHFNRVVIMSDYDRKPGRQTSNESKAEMAQLTNAMLMKGDVCFHEHFVTTHEDPEQLMEMFTEQMIAYKRNIKETERGYVSVIYNGKEGNKKDDMAVTFQRAVYAMHDFYRLEQYAEYWM